MKLFAFLLIASGSSILLSAQRVSRFSVASVRPSQPGKTFDCTTRPGGRFVCHNVPIQNLILMAFQDKPLVPPHRVPRFRGGPNWMADQYDIDAVADGAGEMNWIELAHPLYALLQERFGLEAHLENVEDSGYLLEQEKSGAKLKPSAPDAVYSVKRTDEGLVYTAGTVQDLASTAGNRKDVNAPVMDNTGLEGRKFDFIYRYNFAAAAEAAAATSASGPSSPTLNPDNSTRDSLALLGLQLIPAKVELSVIVIDRIHKPSEN